MLAKVKSFVTHLTITLVSQTQKYSTSSEDGERIQVVKEGKEIMSTNTVAKPNASFRPTTSKLSISTMDKTSTSSSQDIASYGVVDKGSIITAKARRESCHSYLDTMCFWEVKLIGFTLSFAMNHIWINSTTFHTFHEVGRGGASTLILLKFKSCVIDKGTNLPN